MIHWLFACTYCSSTESHSTVTTNLFLGFSKICYLLLLKNNSITEKILGLAFQRLCLLSDASEKEGLLSPQEHTKILFGFQQISSFSTAYSRYINVMKFCVLSESIFIFIWQITICNPQWHSKEYLSLQCSMEVVWTHLPKLFSLKATLAIIYTHTIGHLGAGKVSLDL